MTTEPTRIITMLSAFVTAVIALVVAFGFDLSDEAQKAILGVIAPTVGVIVLAGELIRARVVSPATASEAVAIAHKQPAGSNQVPLIEVNGYKDEVAAHLGVAKGTLSFRPVVDGELGPSTVT